MAEEKKEEILQEEKDDNDIVTRLLNINMNPKQYYQSSININNRYIQRNVKKLYNVEMTSDNELQYFNSYLKSFDKKLNEIKVRNPNFVLNTSTSLTDLIDYFPSVEQIKKSKDIIEELIRSYDYENVDQYETHFIISNVFGLTKHVANVLEMKLIYFLLFKGRLPNKPLQELDIFDIVVSIDDDKRRRLRELLKNIKYKEYIKKGYFNVSDETQETQREVLEYFRSISTKLYDIFGYSNNQNIFDDEHTNQIDKSIYIDKEFKRSLLDKLDEYEHKFVQNYLIDYIEYHLNPIYERITESFIDDEKSMSFVPETNTINEHIHYISRFIRIDTSTDNVIIKPYTISYLDNENLFYILNDYVINERIPLFYMFLTLFSIKSKNLNQRIDNIYKNIGIDKFYVDTTLNKIKNKIQNYNHHIIKINTLKSDDIMNKRKNLKEIFSTNKILESCSFDTEGITKEQEDRLKRRIQTDINHQYRVFSYISQNNHYMSETPEYYYFNIREYSLKFDNYPEERGVQAGPMKTLLNSFQYVLSSLIDVNDKTNHIHFNLPSWTHSIQIYKHDIENIYNTFTDYIIFESVFNVSDITFNMSFYLMLPSIFRYIDDYTKHFMNNTDIEDLTKYSFDRETGVYFDKYKNSYQLTDNLTQDFMNILNFVGLYISTLLGNNNYLINNIVRNKSVHNERYIIKFYLLIFAHLLEYNERELNMLLGSIEQLNYALMPDNEDEDNDNDWVLDSENYVKSFMNTIQFEDPYYEDMKKNMTQYLKKDGMSKEMGFMQLRDAYNHVYMFNNHHMKLNFPELYRTNYLNLLLTIYKNIKLRSNVRIEPTEFVNSIRYKTFIDDPEFIREHRYLYEYLKYFILNFDKGDDDEHQLDEETSKSIRDTYKTHDEFMKQLLYEWSASNQLKDTYDFFVADPAIRGAISFTRCHKQMVFPTPENRLSYNDFVNSILGSIAIGQVEYGVGGSKKKRKTRRRKRKYNKKTKRVLH